MATNVQAEPVSSDDQERRLNQAITRIRHSTADIERMSAVAPEATRRYVTRVETLAASMGELVSTIQHAESFPE